MQGNDSSPDLIRAGGVGTALPMMKTDPYSYTNPTGMACRVRVHTSAVAPAHEPLR